MKKYCILLICFVVGKLFSQSLKEDLLKVNKNYMATERYSLKLCYFMYLDGKINKQFQNKDVILNKDKKNFSMTEATMFEMIETNEMQVTVDHKNKVVAFINYKNSQLDSVNDFEQPLDKIFGLIDENFDSLSVGISKINRKNITQDLIMYDIRYNSGEFTQLILFINTKQNIYTSMTAYYREKRTFEPEDKQQHTVVMKVNYENYTTSPLFNKGEFNTNKILKKNSHGNYETTGLFKDYKLIPF